MPMLNVLPSRTRFKRGSLAALRVAVAAMMIFTTLVRQQELTLANGTETLGDPVGLTLATGTGIVAAGVGATSAGGGTISLTVPSGATIKQALLYWEGESWQNDPVDKTLSLNGTPIVATDADRIASPVFFWNDGSRSNFSHAFRIDITSLGIVQAGSNSIAVEGLTEFTLANNGAGIMVIYEQPGVAQATIMLKDGVDEAHIRFTGQRQVMEPQTFTFASSMSTRTATLAMFFASVSGAVSGEGFRPTSIEVTVNGQTSRYSDRLNHMDGEEWDTLTLPIGIPAGATSLTVQPFSRDDLGRWSGNYNDTSFLPASMFWLAAGLSVPPNTYCRLEIDKQVDKTTAAPGDTLTYHINVRNTGTADCTGGGVKIEDIIDLNKLEYISETHSANFSNGYGCPPGQPGGCGPVLTGSTLTWSGHEMHPGDSGWIDWVARVKEPATCGTYEIPNTARTTASEYDYSRQWVVSNEVITSVTKPCPGTLRVIKHVINNNGGTLQANAFNLTVTGTGGYSNTFAGSETGQVLTDVPFGAYSVDESPVANYAKSFQGDCTGVMVSGQSKVCTVVNDDIPPPPPSKGNLIVIKHVVNDNGGTLQANAFSLHVRTSAGVEVASSPAAGSETGVTYVLDPGTYQVGEPSVASGYNLDSIAGDCVIDSNIAPYYKVIVVAGQSKTCTVTNNDLPPAPKLTVIKHVVNNHSGTAQAADFMIHVTATGGYSNDFHGQEAPGVSMTPPAGAYNVDEDTAPGYIKSLSADCTGVINAGDDKTCTITNTDIPPSTAHLIVKKVVINNDGGTATPNLFTLTVTGTGGFSTSFAGSTAGVDVPMPIGAYSVDEPTVPLGYDKTLSADCTGTIAAGETKTCTVTNDDAPLPGQALLTVIKTVINDNGGTALPSAFTMHVTATGGYSNDFAGLPTPGKTLSIPPGAFAVDETIAAGYSKTLQGDCTGVIAIGQSKTCTIVNNDIPPSAATLLVKKVVVNDNGGTATPNLFTLTVTGTGGFSTSFAGSTVGELIPMPFGAYEVTEAPAVGYAKTLSVDCVGTLAAGQHKECTVTNDDTPSSTAKLIVIKHVINDNSGTRQANDFSLVVAASGGFSNTMRGSETGISVDVPAGAYSVDETDSLGYSKSLSTDCSGTIALGQTKTCTVTNNDPTGGGCTSNCGGGGGGPVCTAENSPKPETVNLTTDATSYSSLIVPLKLTYGSDIKTIVLSNDANFTTQSSVPLSQVVNWTLGSGTGVKTVYARFYDSRGCSVPKTLSLNISTQEPPPPPRVLGETCVNVAAEKAAVTKPDMTYAKSMRGQLLIQTEGANDIWYVDPATSGRFYLHTDACYDITKLLSLGVTATSVKQIPVGVTAAVAATDTDNDGLSDELELALGTNAASADSDSDGFNDLQEILSGNNPLGAGKVVASAATQAKYKGYFIRENKTGAALWYVNPTDSKRYLVPSGTAACATLRSFGIAVTNANLSKIKVGVETKGIGLNTVSNCYPVPAKQLPRTGLPTSPDQLAVLPLIGAYPWLKRRAAGLLAAYYHKFTA